MARYHLSPKDGMLRKCSARIKCEYANANDGKGVEHYDNKAEAMKAYENNMAAENDTFKNVSKKQNAYTIKRKELSTMKPDGIDVQLAEIYMRKAASNASIARIEHEIMKARRNVELAEERKDTLQPESIERVRTRSERVVKECEDKLQEAVETHNKILMEIHPYDDEFDSRGGWNRAFIVSGGHVHKSMQCSTCFETTDFNWLPEYSGKDESEIVEAAGDRACTVCYPSAPVNVLNRPSKMLTPDERKKEEDRVERERKREQKKREAAEKGITNPDGTPLKIDGYTLKSERSAEIQLVDIISDIRFKEYDLDRGDVYEQYGDDWMNHHDHWRNLIEKDKKNVDILVDALANKRGVSREEVLESVERKAANKTKKIIKESNEWIENFLKNTGK